MLNSEYSDFNFLADFLPQMIYTARAEDGKLEYLNKYWYEYTGLSEEESFSGAWEKIIHPEDFPALITAWQNAQSNKTDWELEYRMKNKDGEYFWFLGRSIPFLNNEGIILKWYGSAVNIHDTKQKKLELEVKNELLDTFVYAALHEFKGTINNLVSLSDMLEDINISDKEIIFKAIQNSSKKLDRTITGLAELIKAQNTKDNIYEYVSIPVLLNQIVNEYLSIIKSKQAQIISSFDIENIHYIDAFLSTILKNLVGNALKYHSRNLAPIIHITTAQLGDFIILKVTDNGTGIDLDKYGQQLFSPFKRFNTDVEGTGLGLYLVKNIIEKNGGKITVQSNPGEGTTFNCYLKPYQNY